MEVISTINTAKGSALKPLLSHFKTFLIFTVLTTLTACGSDSSNDKDNTLVNQAPVFTSADTFSTEDSSLTSGYSATANDVNGDNITYSITGGADQSEFLLDSETGELSFVLAPDFEAPHDGNTDNSYEVEISATDDRGAAQQLLVKIIVSGKRAILRIPVVVHVLYSYDETDESNISKEKIFSQIDVLNLDFRKKNTDLIDVPESSKDQIADMEIEFFMAKLDPDGAPTDGITRTERKTHESLYAGVYFTERGGHDAWPTDKYLNIWVLNMDSRNGDVGLAGRAQFPGGDPLTDGVIIAHRAFGTLAPLAPEEGLYLGRTVTHEVGHWLSLEHTDTPLNFLKTYVVDDKMLMFNQAQKLQVHAIFDAGGGREQLYNNLVK